MSAIALMFGAPAAALAGSPSAQPEPQKAPPVSAAASPSPDQAPHPSTFSSSPHTPVTSHPSASAPVTVTPTPRSTEPSQPVSSSPVQTQSNPLTTQPKPHTASRPKSRATAASPIRTITRAAVPARRRAAHRVERRKTAAGHHTQPVHHTKPAARPLLLSPMNPRDLPRLPLEAVAATKATRPDGMMLLLAALALATLVVASLSLLRRLTRLNDEWRGRSV